MFAGGSSCMRERPRTGKLELVSSAPVPAQDRQFVEGDMPSRTVRSYLDSVLIPADNTREKQGRQWVPTPPQDCHARPQGMARPPAGDPTNPTPVLALPPLLHLLYNSLVTSRVSTSRLLKTSEA